MFMTEDKNQLNNSDNNKIDQIEEVITTKAEEIKEESIKGYKNMQESFKSNTKKIDYNLKPVIEELDQIKEEFHKKIKAPIGVKILSAIFTGLVTGILIWIILGIISQTANMSPITWIVGIILIEILDSLSGFTGHVQNIFSKLLQEKREKNQITLIEELKSGRSRQATGRAVLIPTTLYINNLNSCLIQNF